MTTIQVQEVFYSRVEAPYSPRKKSGYQIVYHSPDLPTAVIREVEDRVRCFEASQVDIRYQYFHLPNNFVAIAASQRLEEINTHIIDRAGRPGPFIAHCLVLDQLDFEGIQNNPFAIIDHADGFVLDTDEMIAVQQAQPTHRTLTLDIPDTEESAFDIEGWKAESFSRLWYAAYEADQMQQQRKLLGMEAEDENTIVETLRLLFMYLQPSQRYACTFNTFGEGCEGSSSVFWAVGGYRRVKIPGSVPARLDRQMVDYQPQITNIEVEKLARTILQALRVAQGLEDNQES